MATPTLKGRPPKRFRRGDVVYRKGRGDRRIGRVISADYSAKGGPWIEVEWNDSFQNFTRAAQLCRKPRDRKTWEESEVQNGGRRYWFREEASARAFAANRDREGYQTIHEGRTAWVSLSKRRTERTDRYLGGVDTLAED